MACSLLGEPWWRGGVVAALVVIGDLTSSFIKRRLNVPIGGDLFPLDHLFESLFPALFLVSIQSLTWAQLIIVVVSFILTAYPITLWWKYTIHRAPIENYPRIIRSTVRLREWRSCHVPLARYQIWLNITRILSDQIILTWFAFWRSPVLDRVFGVISWFGSFHLWAPMEQSLQILIQVNNHSIGRIRLLLNNRSLSMNKEIENLWEKLKTQLH